MIVDDEQQIVDTLQLLFEPEYHVIGFTQPQAALEEYINNPSIVAVISDHRMPLMNGLQMFSKMKEACPDRKSFNIIYTGYSEMEGEMNHMIGSRVIHEFLTKSCPTKLLMSVLDSGIKRIKSLPENQELV